MLKLYRLLYAKSISRNVSSIFYAKKFLESKACTILQTNYAIVSINLYPIFCTQGINLYSHIDTARYFSKKKNTKRGREVEEESDSEDDEPYESYDDDFLNNAVTKSVPSMRVDTLMKAGLGISKKKVEQSFYASKIRINGEKVLKKAAVALIGDEIDLVKGSSPDNEKFILVDRIIIKSVGKITGTGMYPVKMEVLRALTIENYEQPWSASSMEEVDDK